MKKRSIIRKIECMVLVLLIFCISHLIAEPCGDVNSKYGINIVDALLIAQFYVGLDPVDFDEAAADVNADGKINIVDALLVAQYYVGLITELPGCNQTPTPTPGLQTYELQAETEATWSSGGTENINSGFTGSGYVNTDNFAGEWVQWSFDVVSETNAHCVFRYASASGTRSMDLIVNGNNITSLTFPSTGSWTTWLTEEAIFGLIAGSNTIRLAAITDDGAPNMDKLDITIGSSIVTPTPSSSPSPTVSPTPTPIGWTPTPQSSPMFHIFLLLGQSNMAGYPKPEETDKVENDRILVLGYNDCSATGRKTDQWDIACPPLHGCWGNAIGPGDWFAKTIINDIPEGDTIGLVPCAKSGERIETFMKVGGSLYSWIINRARLAQQAGGIIEGMLFNQGESNNGDSSWPGKVNTLVTDLRNDLGLGTIPFLAGELLYSGSCAGHNDLINLLPDIISNCYVISASGLVVDPADTQWNLHFGHDSQVTFGKRYAATMKMALGW